MRKISLAFLLLLAAFLVSCSGTVGVEGNPDFDWEGYGTYGWWPDEGFDEDFGDEGDFDEDEGDEDEGDEDPPPNLNDRQNDQRIRLAIDNELQGRGYSYNMKGRSDLEVTFHIANNNEINPEKYGYHWWKGAGNQENKVYPRGTLVIDAINPSNNQIVWRGVDRDAIKSPDENQKTITKAVRKIMSKFPGRN